MGAVLETYEKLIGQMLKEPNQSPQTTGLSNEDPAPAVTPTPGTAGGAERGASGDVRRDLSYILTKVQELRKHHYREQEQLLQGLHSLRHIQVQRRRLTLEDRQKHIAHI